MDLDCAFVSVLQQLKKATVVSDQFFDLPPSSKRKYRYVPGSDNHGWIGSQQET